MAHIVVYRADGQNLSKNSRTLFASWWKKILIPLVILRLISLWSIMEYKVHAIQWKPSLHKLFIENIFSNVKEFYGKIHFFSGCLCICISFSFSSYLFCLLENNNTSCDWSELNWERSVFVFCIFTCLYSQLYFSLFPLVVGVHTSCDWVRA